jgi:hypothetical protein
MLLQFVSPILLMLLFLHALVGYVELGTDSWITNITDKIMESPKLATLLFMWTSGLMFILRFFAGPIVHKISPLGLLFASAVVACTGLLLLSQAPATMGWLSVGFCFIAATVYGFGKTFFWPTMLGVASERFPRGGALTLGMMGGIGMLSAGLLGGPGIGYKQDYFASKHLKDPQTGNPDTYDRYKSDDVNSFLEFTGVFPKISGLDGSKVAALKDGGQQLKTDMDVLRRSGAMPTPEEVETLRKVEEKLQQRLSRDEAIETLAEPSTGAAIGTTSNMYIQTYELSQDDYRTMKTVGAKIAKNSDLKKLDAWWNKEAQANAVEDKKLVGSAELYGGQMALLLTAGVPATMALGYLLLILYFSMTGGYKQVHIDEEPKLPDVSKLPPMEPPRPLDGEPHGITDGIPGEGVQSTPQ